jgi:Glycosyltransferase sugar-binding region containing DXD motif
MSDLAEASPSLRIGQYWDSEEVPADVAALIATFRDLNPDFRHRVFSEAGTERFLAERFGPREVAAFRACAIPSMQSDYFRYCFLLAFGGVYADADYRCVASLRSLLDDSAGGELFLGPRTHDLNGHETRRMFSGLIAFRQPGHPFLRVALDIATANMEARVAERIWPVGEHVVPAIWMTVGPGILTAMRFLREWGSFETFLERIAGTLAEPFGELYCEAIGDYDRIVEAFEGVRVSPYESMFAWIDQAEDPLAYKKTDVHWHNVKTEIFR